jgi:uncharacterized protein YktB (UPF0637 family)
MSGIRSRLRPKLEMLGQRLLPEVGRAIGAEAFAHVARHARRTVNPPEDTWVAFAPDKRGYKKHCHFKVAVSRNAVRFLFEVGPEHGDKTRWATAWKKTAPKLGPVLNRVRGLAYFKNEHDEQPSALFVDLSVDELAALGDAALRTRAGQFVVGRAVSASEAARWTEAQYRAAALDTVRTLSPLYRLP